ncbi:hypothetical protein B0X71_08670 [Planococcus lenghuensis]|uniref:Uncharacterized protein n=1 Tax=Planococcus lenghuensis TaxID=2213202 RepID=A0A1Q2KY54_9BACL|nr:hypothetical protein B0X71_08670 [Planococcus lenghuensis]
MRGFNSKLSIPQVLFSAAFAATILTIFSSMADWENRVIKFVFAFMVSMGGVMISKIIFKDEASNRN